METKYLVLFAAIIVLIGSYGVLTMQLMTAGLLIVLILAIILILRFFNNLQQSLARIEKRLDALEKQ
jgi:membrane protein implicated in regulation of membrane protease activity